MVGGMHSCIPCPAAAHLVDVLGEQQVQRADEGERQQDESVGDHFMTATSGTRRTTMAPSITQRVRAAMVSSVVL